MPFISAVCSIASQIVCRFSLNECTWEPPENFDNDAKKINKLLKRWTAENPGVNIESLDPHGTILLQDAFDLARKGVTWKGA